MKYVQRNPVPVPATGPFGSVQTTLDAVFDWEYALKRQNLLALVEKGKALNWTASDLDWSTDVDSERTMRERTARAGGLMWVLLTPPFVRLAVRTYVAPWVPGVVREALLRVHYRGGQSFLVAPRIADLPDLEEWLREEVP